MDWKRTGGSVQTLVKDTSSCGHMFIYDNNLYHYRLDQNVISGGLIVAPCCHGCALIMFRFRTVSRSHSLFHLTADALSARLIAQSGHFEVNDG